VIPPRQVLRVIEPMIQMMIPRVGLLRSPVVLYALIVPLVATAQTTPPSPSSVAGQWIMSITVMKGNEKDQSRTLCSRAVSSPTLTTSARQREAMPPQPILNLPQRLFVLRDGQHVPHGPDDSGMAEVMSVVG